MKVLDVIAAVLLVIGGLNWGLVGLFNFDLVQLVTGGVSWLANTVYVIVGLAAVYQAIALPSIQKRWHVRPRVTDNRRPATSATHT